MPTELHPSCDWIHIEQLEASTHIGVPEQERGTPQRLTVSISFWAYHGAGDLADNIENAVNYSAVVEETKNFVRDQSVNLIETLADARSNFHEESSPPDFGFARIEDRRIIALSSGCFRCLSGWNTSFVKRDLRFNRIGQVRITRCVGDFQGSPRHFHRLLEFTRLSIRGR
jgi:FolB domain-containing protein